MNPIFLTGITAINNSEYLLKATSPDKLPNRAEIVAWCRDKGLTIDPLNIFIRSGETIRVIATEGSAVFRGNNVMRAMRDSSPEFLVVEGGDKVLFVASNTLRVKGTVKTFTRDGDVIVSHDSNGADETISLGSILSVKAGIGIEAAQALTPEQLVARRLQLG